MSLDELLGLLQRIIHLIPLTFFDLVIIVIALIYIYEEVSFKVASAFYRFIVFLLSYLISILLYSSFSYVLFKYASLPKGAADAFSFSILAVCIFVLFNIIFPPPKDSFLSMGSMISDIILSLILSILSFYFLASIILTAFISFTISPILKTPVLNSYISKWILLSSQSMEINLKKTLGIYHDESLNFTTLTPTSKEKKELNFIVARPAKDPFAASQLIISLNRERGINGLLPLVQDEALTLLAQATSENMVRKSYFSHYSNDGYSVYDRLENANIPYVYAVEILILAPGQELAWQGTLESFEIRRNLFSASFNKLGVGISDAGIYGEIFVILLTD